ncbi:MAG: class I SAM-dependent methyltransferase [Promethearchaeota archaeon]
MDKDEEMDEDIEYVKKGYSLVAKAYRDQKDGEYSKLPIFLEWLNHPNNQGQILELGCASGFPIAKNILEKQRNYTGIDLSLDQINLAHREFPDWRANFHKAEMLEFCRNSPPNMYSGIISMFTIRHLPRIYHVELFTQIYRLLTEDGLLLLDFPLYSDEGRDTWFDDSPMYWSSFSQEWMRLTFKELGFTLMKEFEDIKMFNDKEERTLFLLYQKSKEKLRVD